MSELEVLKVLLGRERRWLADDPNDEDRNEAVAALQWAIERLSWSTTVTPAGGYTFHEATDVKCPKCGGYYVSIPRMGISHVCSADSASAPHSE